QDLQGRGKRNPRRSRALIFMVIALPHRAAGIDAVCGTSHARAARGRGAEAPYATRPAREGGTAMQTVRISRKGVPAPATTRRSAVAWTARLAACAALMLALAGPSWAQPAAA